MKQLFLLLIIPLSIKAQITTDGTLGPAQHLLGPDYKIGPNLGQQYGSNLFHSFQDFNLQSGEGATFSGPNHIQNIMSRVTGGNPSNIDGTIRSTIPNADFYFLNPYGIMFGPNARLEVQGSFHASTAHYLRLGDSGRFDARNPSNSILTIAPVEAFGFFNNQVASISIQGHGEVTQDWENKPTGLNVPKGKTLSLIGGEIEIGMGTFFKTVIPIGDEVNILIETVLPSISARYGRINLAAVASQGEIKLGEDFVDTSSFSQLADIHIKQKSLLRTNGEGSGSIFIRGGQFLFDNSSIEAKTLGSQDGGIIDMKLNTLSLTNGATINGNTIGTGKGPSIFLWANDFITVAGENINEETPFPSQESAIYARSGTNSQTGDHLGDAGEIVLEAKNISFKDGAIISVSTYGGGKGGGITLKGSESISFSGQGIKWGASAAFAATYSQSQSAGEAGSILIDAPNIRFADGSYIDSQTQGVGQGGNITLNSSETIEFSGENFYGEKAYIEMTAGSTGDAGTLLINSPQIFLKEGTNILNKTSGIGNAGDIIVETKDIELTDGAKINSDSVAAGKAGNIDIKATGTITITGANQLGWRSSISSASSPEEKGTHGGDSGNITIDANQLIVKDGGGISVSSIVPEGSTGGRAGDITIRVQGHVELSGVNLYGENKEGFGTGIYARSLGVEDNVGDAGKILLQAGSITIKEGAIIVSSTNNHAPGGNITIDVSGNMAISGDSSHINLKAPADSQKEYLREFFLVQPNSISGIYADSESESSEAGQGGSIILHAKELILTNKGKITTSSAGGGEAGNIRIEVAKLKIDDTATITSESQLSNTDRFASIAERDNRLLTLGEVVEVGQVNDGKTGRYINTGNNLVRVTPINTVANRVELDELANKYNIVNGDVVEVKDGISSDSEYFIYAYFKESDDFYLEDWIKFDDKVTTVVENMDELNKMNSSFESGKEPHPSGTVIRVNDTGNGKPASFVYAILSWPGDFKLGLPVKLNHFTVQNVKALQHLTKDAAIAEGAETLVMDASNGESSRFVYQNNNWIAFNQVRTVADIPAMNQLKLAKPGYIAEIHNADNMIYTGQRWITLNHRHTEVANLTERNKLSAQTGDFVKVLDTGGGKVENFFYVNGEWKKQARGGDAGTITISVRDGIYLTNNSAITTEAISAGGGQINLNTDNLLRLTNSKVTSSVQEGAGNGGDMLLNPQFIVLENGEIIARAFEGKGGNMDITTTGIYRFGEESASPIDASSKLGIDGEVVIHSPDTNVSGALLNLSTQFIDASNQLQSPCNAKLAENMSSFVMVPTEGVTNAPNDLLSNQPLLLKPSPLNKVTATKNQETTAAKHSKLALMTECHPKNPATQKPQAVKESHLTPEQLF